MKIIPREARKITYSTEIRNLKKRLFLSDAQKAFVVGTILGDANLDLNWSKTNYRLRFSHSVKQEDYVMWKYQNLKEWILTKPRYYAKTRSYFFNTISHSDITSLAGLFLKNGKKIIPDSISDFLQNPITLAVWFMDDGNARVDKNRFDGYHINSQSFTLEENQLLVNALYKNFGVFCRIHKNHGKHRLYIGVKANVEKFKKIIQSLVISSLQYKLG
ncbi:MAG: hypothetical protein A2831_03055 [Candidatus Yanofskybacteria bacterium RIFCSPHIGHO2_01_FULL_44_17]|uniref:Homing endonuclease LAGLIDADG domain-containing protein n=1 Tax=Candidatus Yanofskybacteria bacterium RIFCSPHIGHO2_01_FULL_44_17 TaxID=1802668 RepID=A0A1F8F0Q4_9BACT|nr:MAG: hypothetical protein A2831_03055 [Candidatus Yanofskybacteria bacterium RIFCSPHIGHO2_01_FULL_44_17]